MYINHLIKPKHKILYFDIFSLRRFLNHYIKEYISIYLFIIYIIRIQFPRNRLDI
jgi:hypothetical protein